MTHKRGVIGGSKMSNRHQTYIGPAERVIRAAKAMPEVTKVVLSVITTGGGGHPGVKCVPIPAGLRVRVRAPQSAQTLFVYTAEPKKVATDLEALF